MENICFKNQKEINLFMRNDGLIQDKLKETEKYKKEIKELNQN